MNNNSVPGISLFGNPSATTGASLFGQNKGTNPPAANNNAPAGLFGAGGATSFGNSATTTTTSPMFGGNSASQPGTLPQSFAASGSLFSMGGANTNK